MDMPLIQGTISGFNVVRDIAKSLFELKSMSDVQAKVVELQSAILRLLLKVRVACVPSMELNGS